MKTIKFEKLKMCSRQGYWFSAEYYLDGVLRYGRGCHFSDKEQVKQITEEFKAITKESV